MFSQYGEEKVLYNFFGSKKNGLVVDIGACDGITLSNSRHLIQNLSWRGILVEPHPVFFESLQTLYNDNKLVELYNVGCFDENTQVDFYIFADGIDSCGSTISLNFKHRMIDLYGDKFQEFPIKIQTITLRELLLNRGKVDFLSIDCEGVDMQVLKSNNWLTNRPSLICVEHSMDKKELYEFMNEIKYSYYDQTDGNTFFEDSDK
jgi:FkbM family methyltransferase